MLNEKFVGLVDMIQEGEKITIVKFNDFGFPYSLQTTVKNVEIKPYAQYNDTLHLIHRPKRKRSDFKLIIKPEDRFIIWKGWLEVNTGMYTSSNVSNGVTIRKSLSCFSNEYLEIAISSVTTKPLFINGMFTNEEVNELDRNDFTYQIVTNENGRYNSNYFTFEEVESKFNITGFNKNKIGRLELQNQPIINGHTPMWNGYNDGKGVIRYEVSSLNSLLA